MTLSLLSEFANTFQIANRIHSARTGSATVESLSANPPQTDPGSVRNLRQFRPSTLIDGTQIADG